MLHKITLLSAIAALAIAFGHVQSGYAQSYGSQRATQIILAGNGTDIRKTLTLITNSLTNSTTLRLPGDNAAGALTNDGSGNLTWTASSGGSVTSITAGTGLTGGTITSSGTIALDLTANDTWTGAHTFAPITDITGLTVQQTTSGSPASDIFDVTSAGGGTKYLSVTTAGATSASQLGANTAAPHTTLDVNGDFAIRSTTNTSTSATLNDVTSTGTSFICFTAEPAAFTVTGFAGGYDGKMLRLYNKTDHKMTIANESASSASGHRINTLVGFDVTLEGHGTADLIYDGATGEWISTSNLAGGVTGGVAPGVDYGAVLGGSEYGTGSNVTDPNITFNCVANGVYEVQGVLLLSTGSVTGSPAFKLGFTAGTGSVISLPFTVSHSTPGNKTYDAVSICNTEASTVSTTLAKNTDYYVPFYGLVVAGVTGTAHLIWSLPTDATLNANCYMRAMRLQ